MQIKTNLQQKTEGHKWAVFRLKKLSVHALPGLCTLNIFEYEISLSCGKFRNHHREPLFGQWTWQHFRKGPTCGHTGPPAYVARRASTTTLYQSWLYPPSQGLWIWLLEAGRYDNPMPDNYIYPPVRDYEFGYWNFYLKIAIQGSWYTWFVSGKNLLVQYGTVLHNCSVIFTVFIK